MLIWKILYLSFNYKWWSCWLEYSRLQVFLFEFWIYRATPFWGAKLLYIYMLIALWWCPLIWLCFSLAAFRILSFSFGHLIMICHSVSLFGFILFGTLCAYYTWVSISSLRFGSFSNNFSHISNIFLTLFSFCDIYHINVGRHDIIPKILKPFSFFFLFHYFDWVIFIILSSWPLINSYVSPAAAAKSLQSCPTLCDRIDSSPLGSSVPGILQAKILEWVAISFSNAWKWKWSHSVMSNSSRPHGLQPTRLLHPWDFPGKSTGVGMYHLVCY